MRREPKRRRSHSNSVRSPHVVAQHGRGLLSALGSLYVGKKLAEKIAPASDENARPGFPGENHALLKLKGLKMGFANYMGPKTHIKERIARGDPPRTKTDTVAQAHDLRYFKAQTSDDIVNADRKMLAAVKRIKQNKTDSAFNIAQANLIKTKMKFLNKGAFGDLANAATRKMTPLMTQKLEELDQAGYGMEETKELEPVDHVRELKKRMLKFSTKA